MKTSKPFVVLGNLKGREPIPLASFGTLQEAVTAIKKQGMTYAPKEGCFTDGAFFMCVCRLYSPIDLSDYKEE